MDDPRHQTAVVVAVAAEPLPLKVWGAFHRFIVLHLPAAWSPPPQWGKWLTPKLSKNHTAISAGWFTEEDLLLRCQQLPLEGTGTHSRVGPMAFLEGPPDTMKGLPIFPHRGGGTPDVGWITDREGLP